MQVAFGHHGREALKGEYESTAAIHAISPGLCPKPVAWGTFQDDDNAHFDACKYYNFEPNVLPPMESFCEKVALLHKSHTSPEGKFGFHCVTYNGDIPQDNTWCNNWEVFFSRGLRHVLNVREERAGPDPELNELIPALFDKVIPRLLRPLETGGRKVIPSLVHGDLWYGNVGVDKATGESVIYDPSSFWAHNECKFPAVLPFISRGVLILSRQTSSETGGHPVTISSPMSANTMPTCPSRSRGRTTTTAIGSIVCMDAFQCAEFSWQECW